MNREEVLRGQRERRDSEYDNRRRGNYFMLTDEELSEMGVKRYQADSGEEGKEKQHEIDIIPPSPEDGQSYGLPLYIHYNVGGNHSVLCPDYMKRELKELGIPIPEGWEGSCPICAKGEQIRLKAMSMKDKGVDPDEVDVMWKMALSYRPYSGSYKKPEPKQYLMWVRNASDEKDEEENLYVFVCPKSVYNFGILEQCMTPRGDFIDLADPDDGYIFTFKRKGKGMQDTTYFGYNKIHRDYKLEDEWCVTPRFKDVLNFYDIDAMKAMLEGGQDIEEEEGDEDVDKKIEEALEGNSRRRKTSETKEDDKDIEEQKSRVRRRRVAQEPEDIVDDEDDIPF